MGLDPHPPGRNSALGNGETIGLPGSYGPSPDQHVAVKRDGGAGIGKVRRGGY